MHLQTPFTWERSSKKKRKKYVTSYDTCLYSAIYVPLYISSKVPQYLHLHSRAQMSWCNLLIRRRKPAVQAETRPARRREHDLDNVLPNLVLEHLDIALDRVDHGLDVLREHLGRELDIADGHADSPDLLPVVLGAYHVVHHRHNALGDCVCFQRGHQTLRTQDTAEVGLLERRLGIDVADEAVEG